MSGMKKKIRGEKRHFLENRTDTKFGICDMEMENVCSSK
jgi:hypothetical protein